MKLCVLKLLRVSGWVCAYLALSTVTQREEWLGG
jgi:hypothetical protein